MVGLGMKNAISIIDRSAGKPATGIGASRSMVKESKLKMGKEVAYLRSQGWSYVKIASYLAISEEWAVECNRAYFFWLARIDRERGSGNVSFPSRFDKEWDALTDEEKFLANKVFLGRMKGMTYRAICEALNLSHMQASNLYTIALHRYDGQVSLKETRQVEF